MLKITTVDTRNRRKLVLEGKLVEPWVAQLARAWHEARKPYQRRKLVIDLGNVTVISRQGEDVLFEMMSEGAEFVCCGVLTRYVLRQLARKCKAKQQSPQSSSDLNYKLMTDGVSQSIVRHLEPVNVDKQDRERRQTGSQRGSQRCKAALKAPQGRQS